MKTDEMDNVLTRALASDDPGSGFRTASQSWAVLSDRIRTRRRRRIFAAVPAAMLLAGLCLLIPSRRDDRPLSLVQYAEQLPQMADHAGDIRLSVTGRPDMVITAPDANIIHAGNGSVTIYSDEQGKVLVEGGEISAPEVSDKEEFNQIVVPVGKRTQMTLSDGTRIWINSGTRLTYPDVFSKDCREVYLEGEAYFEVAHNESCPFVVRAGNCDVSVLGTVFDVSAYSGSAETMVALVNGSVQVDNREGSCEQMTPGQIVRLQGSALSEPEYEDLTTYVSWVKDYLYFDGEKLSVALEKIGRQYGKTFILAPGMSEHTVSGKLYLKDDLQSVLGAISYSVPVSFDDHNESIYVHESTGF